MAAPGELGTLSLKLERINGGKMHETNELFDRSAIVGAKWAGQRRAVQLDTKNGLPLIWEHTMRLRVTTEDGPALKLPVHFTILGRPKEGSGKEVAWSQLPIDSFLWQHQPTTCSITFRDTLEFEPLFDLNVICCYTAPKGLPVGSRSPQVKRNASMPDASSVSTASASLRHRLGRRPPRPPYDGPELAAPLSVFADWAPNPEPGSNSPEILEEEDIASAAVSRSSSAEEKQFRLGVIRPHTRPIGTQYMRHTTSDISKLTFRKIPE